MSRTGIGLAVLSLFVCSTPNASAQTIELLGTRALGMAGAFVGVADDATAVYWNPAGLATGATASVIFEYGRADNLDNKDAPITPDVVASRLSSRIIATTATSFGVSAYTTTTASLVPANAALGVPATLNRLAVSNYTATLLQTLTEGVVVGSTLRLLRGTTSAAVAPLTGTIDDALDTADDLPERTSTKFDLDIGAMLVFGYARAGYVMRNVTEPGFELPSSADVEPLRLQRHQRIGLAVTPGRIASSTGAGTVIGLDFDITKVDTPRGRQRDLSLGAEQWLGGRRLGVRGGVRWNMLNTEQRAASVGVSFALKPGSFVDAHITRGRVADNQSWSISTRVGF